ncbi:MAG: 4Fe-4S binding protein [Chloroflexota bacterium]|jgi:dihydroorotate dehydrogenase (NAD+) catalytic subunit|nr:4Fe-4S binding protein [Chloroflexota bacterium]
MTRSTAQHRAQSAAAASPDPVAAAAAAATVDLGVEVCGIRFPNPVWTAAGPPVRDGAALLACAEGGAGGLVTKTISRTAAEPTTPNMAEISHGFLNAELWSELPPERWIEREYAITREAGLPVVVSMGYTAEDIAELAPRVRPFADALELSTHYIGEDAGPMIAAIKAAKAAVDVPVFVKLSPLGREMARAAEQAQAAGADAIVAINSFGPCLAIDIESALPQIGGPDGYGWLSGPALKPLAVRCVHDVASAVDIPVIGCGGVSRGTDAVEHLMAGAVAVQVCTAAILRGPGVFGRIATEMASWLAKHGYASPAEVTGLAVRRVVSRPEAPPMLDLSLCNGCGLCEMSCGPDAIHVVEGKAVLDEERCELCGLCVSRCRPGALLWAAPA